jgi:tetratricopeptide (TPR) repeat protein
MAGPRPHSSFTPSLSDPETLEALFVAREGVARSIVDAIRDSATTGNKHQRLLLGPRGIGKTHLVALVHHRVRADRALATRLRIAWLPEDPYVAGYGTLLALIVRQLRRDEVGLEWLGERLDAVLDQDDTARQEAMLERLLLEVLDDRTLLLIVENLDDLLLALREEGQRKLRAFVQNHGRVTILATSTRLIEVLTEREKTFYGFFRTQTLAPFGVEEAADLLARLAKHAGDPELADLIWSPLGLARVRAVHYLAGGNPRVYVIFHDFLTRESLDDLVAPFMRLLDELTPDYQARLNRLAPLQRGIIEALRRLRAAVPVKAIAREVLATSQTVSAQLGKLVDLGYVIQADSLGRSNYYELREPLMRLCLEIREQRSQTVVWFVQFLRVWHSRSDLENRSGREFWRRAMDLAGEPKTAADWNQRGGDLWLTNRPDEALQTYRQALEIDPRRMEAWDDLFGLLREQGRHRLIQRLARRAVSLMPEQARLHCYLGMANRDLGDFDAALACYERALAADPELDQKGVPAALWQAQVLGDRGRYGETLRRLEQPRGPMTFMMSCLYFHRAMKAADRHQRVEPLEAAGEGRASVPCGQSTCQPKNSARFRITPTTAAVMPVSGAVNFRSPWVDSTSGAPARMNRKLGRKVKKVATAAPAKPASSSMIRAEDLLGPGADEADEGHHHDQRPRRGLAQRQAVDHLRAGQPAVGLDPALVDVGQHRVGAAEGDQRGLGEELAHVAQVGLGTAGPWPPPTARRTAPPAAASRQGRKRACAGGGCRRRSAPGRSACRWRRGRRRRGTCPAPACRR